MPVCLRLKTELEPSDLFSLPPLVCRTDWYGRALSEPFEFYFACTPSSVLLGAVLPSPSHLMPHAGAHEFVEGLWEYDVAELFIASTGSTAYHELNLGAQGAWWSGIFDDYRARRPAAPPQNVRTFTEPVSQGVRAALRIAREELAIDLSSGGAANLCAIIRSGDQRTYISAHGIERDVPDYHLRRCFRPIEFHDVTAAR